MRLLEKLRNYIDREVTIEYRVGRWRTRDVCGTLVEVNDDCLVLRDVWIDWDEECDELIVKLDSIVSVSISEKTPSREVY